MASLSDCSRFNWPKRCLRVLFVSGTFSAEPKKNYLLYCKLCLDWHCSASAVSPDPWCIHRCACVIDSTVSPHTIFQQYVIVLWPVLRYASAINVRPQSPNHSSASTPSWSLLSAGGLPAHPHTVSCIHFFLWTFSLLFANLMPNPHSHEYRL